MILVQYFLKNNFFCWLVSDRVLRIIGKIKQFSPKLYQYTGDLCIVLSLLLYVYYSMIHRIIWAERGNSRLYRKDVTLQWSGVFEELSNIQVDIFMFKVNSRNTRTNSEICSKLKIIDVWQCPKYNSALSLCFLNIKVEPYCASRIAQEEQTYVPVSNGNYAFLSFSHWIKNEVFH